jgi:hypothetical protein
MQKTYEEYLEATKQFLNGKDLPQEISLLTKEEWEETFVDAGDRPLQPQA